MSTGAQTTVYYVKETVPGTTPDTPAWKAIGYKSINLKRSQPPLESERMRGDRMASPSVNGVVETSGEIATELVYGEQDDFIAGALGGEWVSNKVKVGKLNQTFSILEKMDGVTGKKWRIYKGCVVNSLSLPQEAGSIIPATYGFVGMDGGFLADAPTGSTFLPATENISMTSMVGALTLDGTDLSTCTALSLEIDNGAEARPVVGSYYSMPIVQRICKVTGTATLYYDDSALAEKAQSEDRIALMFEYKDGVGNKYVVEATKVKPSDAWPSIDGPDDITMEVALTFDVDNAIGSNVTITRVPATVVP
jgi:hypothetical protein